ncbi:MAG: tRNA-intron lyase [Archaeoglobaceae archaeon]
MRYVVAAAEPELLRRGFGRRVGDKVYLHPVEAAYLQLNHGYRFMELEELFELAERSVENFEAMFFVYEDLRSRGMRVRIEGEFLLAKRAYLPLSEREKVKFTDLLEKGSSYENFALAIVDDESEVTYYSVTLHEPRGEQVEELKVFEGTLIGNTVVVEDRELFERFFYGSERRKFVALSLIEAAYLAEMGYLRLKNADWRKLVAGMERKFEVYKDLKRRGLVVKTGFKFGADFRAYEKVEHVEELPHSKYLITIADDREFAMSEIVRAVRLAQSVRKTMLFAVGDVYVKVERVRV